MNIVKKNLVANFLGNFWQALMVLAFIPLYIKFMGIESYGLIGIYATIQAMIAILDLGIGATLTREMARLSALPDKAEEMRNLLRSLEIINWGVAIIIGIIVVAIAPFIAHHWLKPGLLSPHTIERAIVIMGLSMAFQWPGTFYSGGIIGLQKQIPLNLINAGISTFRGVGSIGILWLISPTIQAFFFWQAIVSIIGTSCLGFFLWQQLPHVEGKAIVRKDLLVGIWKFAAGMSGISLLAMILTQMDKIILSKILPLEVFGYYTLAGTVSLSLYRLIGPIFSAVYPRMTQLVSVGRNEEIKEFYHKSCQLMSVLILPVSVVIAVFSFDIMLLWTHNVITAEKSHLILSILILGTALNGLMNIPYALQLAYGWTKLTFYTNLIAIVIMIPLTILLVLRYGAVGGASAWVIINGGYVFFVIYFMHQRMLPHEKWHWYFQDVGLPLAASLVSAGIGRFFVTNTMSKPVMMVSLMIVSVFTLAVTALATSTTRAWIVHKFLNRKLVLGF
jgi:O-antigen/teichoic acid export membrane protein